MLQKPTDFFPDGFLDQIGAQLLVPTEPDAAKAIGIRADATIIGVGTLMIFAHTGTQGFYIISIAATRTHNQALQQIFGPSLRDASALAVFLQLLLDGIKKRCIDQSRDRNAHPLLRRQIVMGIGMFGLQRPPPLRPQTRTQWFNRRFAKGCFALVGRVFEHAANGGAVPHRFARSGPLLGRFQTTTNLSNGAPISSDPLKDLTDHTCLFPHNLKTGLPGTLLFSDIAIPIGGSS